MEKRNNTPDRLTDKAFTRLMITSVLGILMCMMCLCSATWALFSDDVSATGNTLASGRFGLSVSVSTSDSTPITTARTANGATVATLTGSPDGVYHVTLKMTDDTTVTKGFCTVIVDGVEYRTASINQSGTNPFDFTVVTTHDVTVRFTPAWGLPAEYDVEIGESLVIP